MDNEKDFEPLYTIEQEIAAFDGRLTLLSLER